MTPPAPLSDPAYQHAFQASNYIAELFKPSGPAFAELWLDGEKVTTMEYWKKDLLEGATGVNHIPPVGVLMSVFSIVFSHQPRWCICAVFVSVLW